MCAPLLDKIAPDRCLDRVVRRQRLATMREVPGLVLVFTVRRQGALIALPVADAVAGTEEPALAVYFLDPLARAAPGRDVGAKTPRVFERATPGIVTQLWPE